MVTQIIVVIFCVALAVAYMIRKALRALKRRGQCDCVCANATPDGDKSACGSCAHNQRLRELRPK